MLLINDYLIIVLLFFLSRNFHKTFFCRYVLGHEAMKRMGLSNVLISGMKGLGVEVGMLYSVFKLSFVISQDNTITTFLKCLSTL